MSRLSKTESIRRQAEHQQYSQAAETFRKEHRVCVEGVSPPQVDEFALRSSQWYVGAIATVSIDGLSEDILVTTLSGSGSVWIDLADQPTLRGSWATTDREVLTIILDHVLQPVEESLREHIPEAWLETRDLI